MAALTLGQALACWRDLLAAAGCSEPDAEARLIAAHVTGLALGQLPARRGDALPPEAPAAAEPLLEGRRRREPLPYLLGRADFMGLPLRCDRRALVPRPETELLVEAALAWLRAHPGGLVADIGTGSGCVALAIASLAPGVKVVATEASAEALALARENAEALGLADRVTLLGGDLLEPLARAGLADGVTAVVANLPYLSEADYAAAPPELGFEPRDALVAGPTGLEAIRRLAAELPSLRRLGFVALEIGATQGPAVAALLAESLAGWTVRIHCDLAGLDRVAIAERSATGGDAAP